MDATVECLCPDGQRHPEGDVLTFRDVLDFRTLATARQSIIWMGAQHPDADVPEFMAVLSEFYLLHCIEKWTIQDEKGKAVPVSKAAVEQYVMARPDVALQLAEFADSLYQEKLLRPLVSLGSNSSRATRTNGSTSPQNGTGKSRKHSKRSSTTTSPTAVTETTAT